MRLLKLMIFIIFILITGCLLISSGDDNGQGDPWTAPEEYQNMKNPIAVNGESISIGKSLYMQHCKSCHGKEGLGDGPKAAQLDTPSGDFTDEDFQAQSDGSMFYKTREGRDDMPGFSKKIPDQEDMWSIVNFLRTLE